jgi:hypothetical protein
VHATNTLTLNRFQFFGVMTREYLDQIVPVAASAPDCFKLSLWAGLFTSAMPAITRAYRYMYAGEIVL